MHTHPTNTIAQANASAGTLGSQQSAGDLQPPSEAQMLAHDLNNFLAVVSGRAEMILSRNDASVEVKKSVNAIFGASERMKEMTKLVLNQPAKEGLSLYMARRPVDVHELIRAAGAIVRQSSTHRLKRVLAPNLPAVAGDRVLLRRALENVMANALKYAPDHPEILVTVQNKGHAVLVRICDHGPGVPTNMREQVFAIGFRLEQHLGTSDETSRGLGLSFVRQIINAHGGKVWIEGNKPHGAIFCIELPVDAK